MANHKSAIKRIRSNERKHEHNRVWRSKTRTFVKKARMSMDGGDVNAAREAIRDAVASLDKAANKGVIHPRNAARRKSRLMKKLAQLEAQK